jgi:hypothetical protein
VIGKRAPYARRIIFETGPLSEWFYDAPTAQGCRRSALTGGMPRLRSTWPRTVVCVKFSNLGRP